MEKENGICILTGDEARRAVTDILAHCVDDGHSVHYPLHIGTCGYFRDSASNGKLLYSAFDNTTGDCWCEDFKTEECALKWCRNELGTDEAHQLESNVESIILNWNAFADLSGEKGNHNSNRYIPPYVKFDFFEEFHTEMQFFDGYAYDLNPHGLGFYDRLGLYYPTVAEIAGNPAKQEEIEKYTGRRWAEGSAHEKIFDIALKYGIASRLNCPKERFDAAVAAVVSRASDSGAREFTPEQRAVLNLAADSSGYRDYPDFRDTFFSNVFSIANGRLKGVPKAWADDTLAELRELAKGEVRDRGVVLHR